MEDIYKTTPVVISVVLYNYNYLDNKIIAALKNHSYVFKKENGFLSVPASELLTILKTKFEKELNETSNYSADRYDHGINSAFQIYQLLVYYLEAKVINIYISMLKDYSRLINSPNGDLVIALDYKIEKAIIRYDLFLDLNEIDLLNNLLRDIGLINTIIPLTTYNIYCFDFIDKVKNLTFKQKEKYERILDFNKQIFIDKLTIDNPLLIIITDHLQNI